MNILLCLVLSLCMNTSQLPSMVVLSLLHDIDDSNHEISEFLLVVAVGYTSGKLILCDVENSDVLHTTVIQGQITHMSWISHNLLEGEGEAWSNKPYPEDTSETFLPKLQPLNKRFVVKQIHGTGYGNYRS